MVSKKTLASMKEKILKAAASFRGEKSVTQLQIANRAGVGKSRVTDCMTEYPGVREIIERIKRPSVKQRILLAISYFKSRGFIANREQIRQKAGLYENAIWYWAKHSALIRAGLESIKPMPTKQKVLSAMDKLINRGHPLTTKAICSETGITEEAYRNSKRHSLDIRIQLKVGLIPLTVEQRIYRSIHYFENKDIIVTKKMIADRANISRQTLLVYEKKLDGLIGKAVREIIPLSSDEKLFMALGCLALKSQLPSNKNLAIQAEVSLNTVRLRLKANAELAHKVDLARKKWAQRQNSFTNRPRKDFG